MQNRADNNNVNLTFQMADGLFDKLRKGKLPNSLIILQGQQQVSVAALMDTFQQIEALLQNKKTTSNQKVLLEKYKQCIMQSILQHLSQFDNPVEVAANPPISKRKKIWKWLKIGFVVVVSFIGLVESCMGGFLGAQTLILDLIPAIASPALIAVSVFITIINIISFIAFEVSMLKTMLGVESKNKAMQILESIAQQIDISNKLNAKLADINIISQLTSSEYKQLSQIACQFSQAINAKKAHYQTYKEHPLKKAIRFMFAGFGAILCGLGSYFGATSFLTSVAAGLVGTPIGWAIIGTLVASGLVFYFAMQGSGMGGLFNSTLDAFNNVKEKLSGYMPKNDYDYKKVLVNKHIFKKIRILSSKETKTRPLVDALDLDNQTHKRTAKNHRFFSTNGLTSDALTDYDCERLNKTSCRF